MEYISKIKFITKVFRCIFHHKALFNVVLFQYYNNLSIKYSQNTGMQTAVTIIGFISIFLCTTLYFLSCVDPLDKGLPPLIRKLMFTILPSRYLKWLDKIMGIKVRNKCKKIKYYLQQTNHPLIMYMYFVVCVALFCLYCYSGIHRYMPNRYISMYNVILAYVIALYCYWSYYRVCKKSPGQINQSNALQFIKKQEQYYDGVLYTKNNICSTCKIIKPPRSKHCKLCGVCIPKFDHHCMWIGQCVGEGNYKQFIQFVAMHALWATYLTIIGVVSVYEALESIRFWNLVSQSGDLVKVNFGITIYYVLIADTCLFICILASLVISVTMTGFFIYHLWLISQNMTTNQHIKSSRQIKYLRNQLRRIEKSLDYKQHRNKSRGLQQLKDDKVRIEDKLNSICNIRNLNKGFIKNMKQIFWESKPVNQQLRKQNEIKK